MVYVCTFVSLRPNYKQQQQKNSYSKIHGYFRVHSKKKSLLSHPFFCSIQKIFVWYVNFIFSYNIHVHPRLSNLCNSLLPHGIRQQKKNLKIFWMNAGTNNKKLIISYWCLFVCIWPVLTSFALILYYKQCCRSFFLEEKRERQNFFSVINKYTKTNTIAGYKSTSLI